MLTDWLWHVGHQGSERSFTPTVLSPLNNFTCSHWLYSLVLHKRLTHCVPHYSKLFFRRRAKIITYYHCNALNPRSGLPVIYYKAPKRMAKQLCKVWKILYFLLTHLWNIKGKDLFKCKNNLLVFYLTIVVFKNVANESHGRLVLPLYTLNLKQIICSK